MMQLKPRALFGSVGECTNDIYDSHTTLTTRMGTPSMYAVCSTADYAAEVNLEQVPITSHVNGLQGDNNRMKFKNGTEFANAILEHSKYSNSHTDDIDTVTLGSSGTPRYLQPIENAFRHLWGEVSYRREHERFDNLLVEWDGQSIRMLYIKYDHVIRIKLVNSIGRSEVDILLHEDLTQQVYRAETTLGLTITIPLQHTLAQVSFAMTCLWMVRAKIATKAIMRINAKESVPLLVEHSTAKKTNRIQGSACDPSNGVHYVTHDLECTVPTIVEYALMSVGIVIPPSGEFHVFVPTLGRESVDVHDCCINHDIALWCSQSRYPEAWQADCAVLGCILGRLYDAYTRGSDIEDIANVSWFILQYGWLVSLVTVFGNISAGLHGEDLLNLDGRNNQSCLCGGKNPTTLCNDRCRNLCREMGRQADCDQCKPICVYNNGKATGFAGNPSSRCCPGTNKECYTPPKHISGRKLKAECPDKCYDCYYECDVCHEYHFKFCPHPGVGKLRLLTDPNGQRQCCAGTPEPIYCPIGIGQGNQHRPNA